MKTVLPLSIICCALLSACGAPSRIVVLQQPETKQTVECKVDPWGSMNYNLQIEKCILAYTQAGYSIVGDSHKAISK